MHALEKTKLVRHHASRLRKLGADETLVAQLLTQLNRVRARQTRSQEYTVLKEKKTRPSSKREPSKPKPPHTTKNKTAHSSARASKKTPPPTGSAPADEG